jgi:hypothetical protein
MNYNHLREILQGTFTGDVYDFAFLKYFNHIILQAQVQKKIPNGNNHLI